MSEEKDIAYEAYKEQRFEADRFALEIGGRFDKMVMTLSGGSLALSITFLEKIAPNPIQWSLWILGTSWLLLVISLLLDLSSLAESQNALQKKISNADNQMLQRFYPEQAEYKDLETERNDFREKVSTYSNLCKWTCILGVSLLASFALINATSIKPNKQNDVETETKHAEEHSKAEPRRNETSKGKGILHPNSRGDTSPETKEIVENRVAGGINSPSSHNTTHTDP
ncbi:hypothetical protein QEH56_24260 [Pelagicoccus enzymogenes]|uniref:hypothetical protein n=1 Tax=Pelagicoccus enzymogenes TaxID=2773457 RepID=UPI00280E1A64|nr:hypothetical protein [Pelagicoccus enzymogenes]MDQ8201296.1 hypothetical protein [Pelagicoccus enzymogenes]